MFGIHFGDNRQTLVLDSCGVEDCYSGSCFSVKLLKEVKTSDYTDVFVNLCPWTLNVHLIGVLIGGEHNLLFPECFSLVHDPK